MYIIEYMTGQGHWTNAVGGFTCIDKGSYHDKATAQFIARRASEQNPCFIFRVIQVQSMNMNGIIV